jgi:glutaredoxin 3
MATVVMYSTEICPYCVQAKKLLDSKGVHYTEIRVDQHPAEREKMVALSGRRTVPQIFINDQPIGGCDDLYALNHSGELDKLLK